MDPERRRYYELLLRATEEVPPYPGTFEGCGIVTCGSVAFTPYLWVLIRSLRHHGCTLPVELWHMAREVNPALRRLLEPWGVSFRDAGDLPWRHYRFKNGAHGIKPYAILHSSFRKVLFLDADNCVFRDPAFLFDTPEFFAYQAIFWRDIGDMAGRLGGHRLRQDFGLRGAPGREFESGEIVLDKEACWRALAVTLHLNEHCAYYYRYLFGDKETFRLAFDFLRQPYFLMPHAPQPWRGGWRTGGMIQPWIDGTPLFHHRTTDKWDLRLAPAHDLPALPAVLVRDLLDELRRRWPELVPLRLRFRFSMAPARTGWERFRDRWPYYLGVLTDPARLWNALRRRLRPR